MKALLSPIIHRLSFLNNEGVRKAIVYFLIIMSLFLAIVFVDSKLITFNSLLHLALLLTIVLLAGILNNWLLNRFIYNEIPEWLKAIMTLSANLVGAVLFMIISPNSTISYYSTLFLPAMIFFSLPLFFMITIKAILGIPSLEYLPLKIKNLKDIVAEINWAEDETKGIVWEFENLTEMESDHQYWIRTHTPFSVNDIKLKDLFKCLLSLHNHNLSPGLPIHFENGDEYYGWRFFYQTNYIFWKKLRPLNPEVTIKKNGINFHRLSRKEREEMENLRKDLSKKFRTTKIFVIRTSA